MATFLTDLDDVLRRAGLKVVEIPGWKTRGRPGSFAPVGVLCHHTGGANTGLSREPGYARWMAVEGRSDLSAPLAQLGLGRDGTFYILAAGRANHAGRCKPIAGLKPYPGRDYGDGNAQLIGIEALNSGSEGWTKAQYDAYVRGCAALNAAYGFPVRRTLAHRETSLSGKPDPGGINMTAFRADVAAVDLTPAPTPEPPKEIDMTQLVQLEGTNPVWVTNLITRRHVADPTELEDVKTELKRRGLPTDVQVVKRLGAYGVVVGSDPLAKPEV